MEKYFKDKNLRVEDINCVLITGIENSGKTIFYKKFLKKRFNLISEKRITNKINENIKYTDVFKEAKKELKKDPSFYKEKQIAEKIKKELSQLVLSKITSLAEKQLRKHRNIAINTEILNPDTRAKLVSDIKKQNPKTIFGCIYLDTPLDVCLSRIKPNGVNSTQQEEQKIKEKAALFKKPTLNEGYDLLVCKKPEDKQPDLLLRFLPLNIQNKLKQSIQ